MANLIITIIGIALIAIVAIAGIFYGGSSFTGSQAKAWANAMANQNQQLLAAANNWSVDHGGDIFSDVGIGDLYNQGYLSAWPVNVAWQPKPAGAGGGFSTGTYDLGCYDANGYQGLLQKSLCTSNGVNLIFYAIRLNDPVSGACGSLNAGYGYGFENANYANHPMVQLAIAVNQITGAVPATATIAPSGVPYQPTSGAVKGCPNKFGGNAGFGPHTDGSGNLQIDYCYLLAGAGATSVTQMGCFFSP
jgi:hypothetical protein